MGVAVYDIQFVLDNTIGRGMGKIPKRRSIVQSGGERDEYARYFAKGTTIGARKGKIQFFFFQDRICSGSTMKMFIYQLQPFFSVLFLVLSIGT